MADGTDRGPTPAAPAPELLAAQRRGRRGARGRHLGRAGGWVARTCIPTMDERFTVLEGRMASSRGANGRRRAAGETAVVPAGAPARLPQRLRGGRPHCCEARPPLLPGGVPQGHRGDGPAGKSTGRGVPRGSTASSRGSRSRTATATWPCWASRPCRRSPSSACSSRRWPALPRAGATRRELRGRFRGSSA